MVCRESTAASDPARLVLRNSGFVNGETSSVLGGTLSVLDSNSATTTAVGSYTGVITASGQTSTNYTITYVAGNLTGDTGHCSTITARRCVASLRRSQIPLSSVSYTGFVNGETTSVLGGTLSLVVETNAATTTAGSYTGVITASGQTATNYTITYDAGNLTVTPAHNGNSANSVSRVYGSFGPGGPGVMYSGFVNGETPSVLGGTLSIHESKSATTTAAGGYTDGITASGQTSTNYTITYVAGNLTLSTPAAASAITADGVQSRHESTGLYRSRVLGVSYAGFVNGETSSVLGGTLSDSRLEVGHDDGGGQLPRRRDHGLRSDLDEPATITYDAGDAGGHAGCGSRSRPMVCREFTGARIRRFGVTYSGFVNGETSSVLGRYAVSS